VAEEELIGVWSASDGAELSLNADKTFSLKGFDPAYWKIGWRNKKHSFKVDGIGEWKIENRNKKLILNLSFTEVMGEVPHRIYNEVTKEYVNTRVNYSLEISGCGFLGNKRPWILRSYYEDDFDFSVFRKVK
jgi:hypothetical protein